MVWLWEEQSAPTRRGLYAEHHREHIRLTLLSLMGLFVDAKMNRLVHPLHATKQTNEHRSFCEHLRRCIFQTLGKPQGHD
jgi:hypothetical protein